ILMAYVSAAMPIVVSIQVANAVATVSVGEKYSPLPLLSTGASVIILFPERTCVARVRNLPKYTTCAVIIILESFIKFVQMLRVLLTIFFSTFFVLPNMAQSFEKNNPVNASLNHEISGGFHWHPRGLGLNVKSGVRKSGNVWRMLDFDLVTMKHEKERRIRSSSFSAPGSRS